MATQATSSAGEASLAADLPPAKLRQWLRDMLLIREFEVRTMQAYQNRQVGGFCHVYIGQEAVAVGCIAAARDDDPVITAYRDHGHALARGMDPKYGMAELFGRIGGCAKGKGGSMHFFDASRQMYGGHGIVAAQCPLGAGLAFATKYEDEVIGKRKSDRVTLCFFGDGALNQGAFHESMNLAGILDLPLLFICENNGYAMGTAIGRGTTMGHEITAKAAAYGMHSLSVDGMDVMAVYDGIRPVIDRCRETLRPVFVEMRTYRYKGHSMSDPRKYRTKEEEERYEANDAIEKHAAYLKREHGLTEEEFAGMTKDVKKQVRAAMKWATDSPAPDLTELYTDVYCGFWGPYQGTSQPEMMRGSDRR